MPYKKDIKGSDKSDIKEGSEKKPESIQQVLFEVDQGIIQEYENFEKTRINNKQDKNPNLLRAKDFDVNDKLLINFKGIVKDDFSNTILLFNWIKDKNLSDVIPEREIYLNKTNLSTIIKDFSKDKKIPENTEMIIIICETTSFGNGFVIVPKDKMKLYS